MQHTVSALAVKKAHIVYRACIFHCWCVESKKLTANVIKYLIRIRLHSQRANHYLAQHIVVFKVLIYCAIGIKFDNKDSTLKQNVLTSQQVQCTVELKEQFDILRNRISCQLDVKIVKTLISVNYEATVSR